MLGHVMLVLLIAAGWTAALANVAQAVATLQLNFWANRQLTWRRLISGSRLPLWRRWGRFHLARGASLLLSVAAFPVVAPRLGPAIAYWGLLAAACVVNFYSDKYWSFRAARSRNRRPRHAARRGPARRLLVVGLATAPFALLAALSLDWFLLATSSFMLVVATTTLAFQMVGGWLAIDHVLLFAGLAAIPVGLLVRRLRPAALALAIQWLILVRGGYVPFMHVLNLMPWSALLAVGAVESLRLRPLPRRLAKGVAAAALAGVVALSWAPSLQR